MKNKTKPTTRTVFVPKSCKNDDAVYVSVNGKPLLVKKGEPVELPVCFAEVLENSALAQSEAERFIESQAQSE